MIIWPILHRWPNSTNHSDTNIEHLNHKLRSLAVSPFFAWAPLNCSPTDRMRLIVLPNDSILELYQMTYTDFFRFRTPLSTSNAECWRSILTFFHTKIFHTYFRKQLYLTKMYKKTVTEQKSTSYELFSC